MKLRFLCKSSTKRYLQQQDPQGKKTFSGWVYDAQLEIVKKCPDNEPFFAVEQIGNVNITATTERFEAGNEYWLDLAVAGPAEAIPV